MVNADRGAFDAQSLFAIAWATTDHVPERDNAELVGG